MTHVLIFFLAVASGDIGVIDMALLSVIRRWHFRDGMPIREIERRTGLSRNTIRKYLRSGAIEPKFKGAGRPSKLDPLPGSCPAGCRSRRVSRASSAAQFGRCMPILSYWALRDPIIVWLNRPGFAGGSNS